MQKMYIQLTIVIEKEGKAYTALCRELGTASCGDSIEEAAENIREAIELHLNTIEMVGERKAFFQRKGIKTRRSGQAPPKRVNVDVEPSAFVTGGLFPVGC